MQANTHRVRLRSKLPIRVTGTATAAWCSPQTGLVVVRVSSAIRRDCDCRDMRSRVAIGRLSSSAMRRCVRWNTSRTTSRTLSGCSMCAAGSGAFQCAVAHSRPYRTRLTGHLVADGDNQIHLRRVRPRELVPRLASCIPDRQPLRLQVIEDERVYGTAWVTPGAIPLEAHPAERVQQRLRDDAARRVAGTQEEDI